MKTSAEGLSPVPSTRSTREVVGVRGSISGGKTPVTEKVPGVALARSIPSSVVCPVPLGSRYGSSNVHTAESRVQKSSSVGMRQLEAPESRLPTKRPAASNIGPPEEPPSVAPRSQSRTRQKFWKRVGGS